MNNLIPRGELNTLTKRWFDELWNDFGALTRPTHLFNKSPVRKTKFSYPKVNIRNDEKEFVIEAAVPGLTKDDVKVEYANETLTISADKVNAVEDNRDGYYIRELHKSSFSRSITIDENFVDIDGITANVENGMLTIKLPKIVVDQPEEKRTIKIE